MKLFQLKRLFTFILFTGLILFSCTKPEPKWEILTMGFSENFHDILPIDKNNIIAYSYGTGLIVKSEDLGLTWKEVFKTDSIYFEQVAFPTPKVGFICGNTNRILKTNDGGNTWAEILIDSIPDTAPVYGMKFLNKEVGFISVINRVQGVFETEIYQTKNSGISWKKINTLSEMILNLEYVDNELWASGNNVVLKNIDKKNWQTVYKDTTKQVGQIRDFIHKGEQLIMSSFNGFIIRKNGSTFSKEKITPNRLRSIVRVNDHKLIVAGDNDKEEGNIFESNDNGISWNLIDEKFNDIHRLKVANGIVWGIGKKDEIIKFH